MSSGKLTNRYQIHSVNRVNLKLVSGGETRKGCTTSYTPIRHILIGLHEFWRFCENLTLFTHRRKVTNYLLLSKKQFLVVVERRNKQSGNKKVTNPSRESENSPHWDYKKGFCTHSCLRAFFSVSARLTTDIYLPRPRIELGISGW